MGARSRWDLSALLNAADPHAPAEEQHLWVARWLQWLRAPGPARAELLTPSTLDAAAALPAATPWPVQRLRLFVQVVDRNPEQRARIGALLRCLFGRLDATGLLADFGFAPHHGFLSELEERARLGWLPGTPETNDLGALFPQWLGVAGDADWIDALDDDLVARVLAWCVEDTHASETPLRAAPPQTAVLPAGGPGGAPTRPASAAADGPAPRHTPMGWDAAMVESIQLLASQVRAAGLSGPMRRRMEPDLLTDRPFHQVVRGAEALRDATGPAELRRQASYLRAVLQRCREAAASVRGHLDEHGISVDLVFISDQLQARGERIEALLDCLLAERTHAAPPAAEFRHLLAGLARGAEQRRSLRALFARHYALLARKVTERSAESGAGYITRTRAEYGAMLRRAAGGGAVLGLTTLNKFALGALALSAFWSGLAAGANYALSFVFIYLLHWTVATKQPAMTAPALAAKLEGVSVSDEAVERFIDEVAHLLRSQFAGIVGNLVAVVPVVLMAQALSWWAWGAPAVGPAKAAEVLHSLHLLGPTALFAAFTGVLLFLSSLVAGWVENWFVFHRIDSAIAWHPGLRERAGAARAHAIGRWWRRHVSGLAANVSLGLMLGLAPVVASFFGLPLEVRHVTLAMGQLAAALGALGPALLQAPAFWWCLASIPVVALLNLGVSFTLAFRLAVSSRGLRLRDRGRIYAALLRRLARAPWRFLLPPDDPPANRPHDPPARPAPPDPTLDSASLPPSNPPVNPPAYPPDHATR